MNLMHSLPEGFGIGHWSDPEARTGCTVILCPPATVGSADIRGASPGTREFALLAPDKKMSEVHAVLLTGGSAFGLAAADGVVRALEERGIGYSTPWAKVPIVPAAVIFDLNVGSGSRRPGPEDGYRAVAAASAGDIPEGSVGVGTGASVGKWGGLEGAMTGGFGLASLSHGRLIVTAAAAVNAVGDILDERGEVIAGARDTGGGWAAAANPARTLARPPQILQSNTTLVVVMTNARMSKIEAHRASQRGHDGLARAIRPVHTSYDGDAVVWLASGTETADFDQIAELGADAAARAIRSAVKLSRPL
jgi:L-aminopeptidase/D-esterase-like protein